MRESVGDEGVVKALTSRSAWKRDEAALGTEVHNIADLIVSGKPTPEMSPAALERVMRYKDWWQASGWTIRLSEALVVHPTAKYGGTFDLLARDRGRDALLPTYWSAAVRRPRPDGAGDANCHRGASIAARGRAERASGSRRDRAALPCENRSARPATYAALTDDLRPFSSTAPTPAAWDAACSRESSTLPS